MVAIYKNPQFRLAIWPYLPYLEVVLRNCLIKFGACDRYGSFVAYAKARPVEIINVTLEPGSANDTLLTQYQSQVQQDLL